MDWQTREMDRTQIPNRFEVMPIITSLFLVISLVLAVLLGPQTRPWSWGPSILALGISVISAMPVLWKRDRIPANFWIVALAMLTAAWFAWRALDSPVVEFGWSDLLLLCSAICAFISVCAIAGHVGAERILSWGLALLLLANLVVIGIQIFDPEYSPIFRARATPGVATGFFSHYNEAANYLVASSMLVGAAALFGRHSLVTRMIWGLLALAGLCGVWFTHSRGGILAAALAGGVFAAVVLMIGKRREARWFAPTLIAIPVIGMAIAAFWFMGWQQAQEARHANTGLNAVLDNTCRLYFLGIAMSCIGQHPLTGGGSQSFSWECFRWWDQQANGYGFARPEMVHNEIIQSATDYGLIGSGLLLGFLVVMLISTLLKILFAATAKESHPGDSWKLGALAALVGMLVQSCFSFVFHLLPGIILLGICLGLMSRPGEKASGTSGFFSRMLCTVAAVACALVLFPYGWKGTQVTRCLWPLYIGKQAVASSETQIDALTEAIHIWPHYEFYQMRAGLFHESKARKAGDYPEEAVRRALGDWQEAALLQPFNPACYVNIANLCSQLQMDPDAENAFAKAIHLEGGMEAGFAARFLFANHLLRKGQQQFRDDKPALALDTLEHAAKQIEESEKTGPAAGFGMLKIEVRLSIHENLGAMREANGDTDGALACYNFASGLQGGPRNNYRAGVLIGKKAVTAWSQRRPSEALTLFMEARKRAAGNPLPPEVTANQRAEFISYLDKQITFLKGAKIEPAK